MDSLIEWLGQPSIHEARVPSAINFAPATGAQTLENLITSEARAGQQSGLSRYWDSH
jgi:hypothetical protein